MSLVIVIIILALVFDYINGFHDAANSIATIVSTKVLTPFQAVLWAALFNFAAYWIFKDHAVANSISKTVHKEFITLPVILSGLIAAIFWNLLTWWYGIPSSSSHTLIGGFAGAAITHALIQHKGDLSWTDIVESKTIAQTLFFIILAPLIGMIISAFIAIVTIMRNLWIRFGIIALATLFTALLFDMFENNKMLENTQKFYKIDKYKKEVADHPNDTIAQQKLAKAESIYVLVKPLVEDYDRLGAKSIAKTVYENGWLKDIEASRLKDEVRNANDYLIVEAEAVADPKKEAAYKEAKEKTEKYKGPLKQYLAKEISMDSLMIALNTIYPVHEKNIHKVKTKIDAFDIESAFAKNIDKSNNSSIVWGIIIASIFFCLVYLYTEKIKTPTSYRVAKMFKGLQLFSSAAFSLGHGGNDAQKVMGIIGAALIANGTIQDFGQLPNWVPIACYLAIGLGTLSGGWKIVKTMGTKITKVTPLEGVAAETAGAFTLFFTGQMGIPVSTTHTITGSIIGVGATKRLSAVRWGVTTNLLWAWLLTIPVSAALAALTYWVCSWFV
jgi:PiT family inorganic phosphate transporter